MNARGDLPGPGDESTWGPVRGTNDPRYCAEEMPSKLLESLTREVVEEWLRDAEKCGLFAMDFTDADFAAISEATAANDEHSLMFRTRVALRKAMKVAAQQEALERYQRQVAEDELDAAISAARSYG